MPRNRKLKDTAMIKRQLAGFAAFLFLLVFCCSSFAAEVKKPIQTISPLQIKMSKAIVGYLVTKYPEYEGKKIDVDYRDALRTFRDLKYRKGELSFSVAELYPDFKPVGNIIVPIQITVDGIDKEKLFLRTKVSVYDRIVVAKTRLKRGDTIGTLEAGLEERDIAVLGSDIIMNMDDILGKELKSFVLKGNPIYERAIKDRPMVKKDDKVKITASFADVQAETFGIALENGKIGQEIRVKNIDSGKELIGVVVATGEVAVK
jgi:flagella basal body P-ring formation protein FlgA